MLDELFTNGIGCFGEFHVTRPGGDRLLWVEWTDGLIPIGAEPPGFGSSVRLARCLKREVTSSILVRFPAMKHSKARHPNRNATNVLSAFGTSSDGLRS